MSCFGCMQHGLHRTAFGCTLLAVLLLAPARATASCGAYVTILNHQSVGPLIPHSEAQEGEILLPIKHSPVWPFPVRTPCSGPECSSVPITPPLAPATALPMPGEQAALVNPADQLWPPRLEARPRLSVHIQANGSPGSIFHPPRTNFTSSLGEIENLKLKIEIYGPTAIAVNRDRAT
jgi:hypothetical protein